MQAQGRCWNFPKNDPIMGVFTDAISPAAIDPKAGPTSHPFGDRIPITQRTYKMIGILEFKVNGTERCISAHSHPCSLGSTPASLNLIV
jgi:hypothetical protein